MRVGEFRTLGWLLATAVCALFFVGAVVRSLTAAPPIKIAVMRVQTTGNTNHIQLLALRVTNTSSKPVSPQFDTVQSEYNSTFWNIASGPKQLPPHTTADYTVLTPNAQAQPSIYGGFNVVGYVQKPRSFSVSRMYAPSLLGLTFSPVAQNQPVAIGTPYTLSMDLVSHEGTLLHRAGVRVRLNELTWSPTGPKKGLARINGGRVGKFAFARTNSQGVAKFRIVGVGPSGYDNVTFTAYLSNSQYHYVYSASGNFNIRFIAR
jgi:hypothetical protein